ncbi:MAG TPA: hypothetical protein VG123_02390 [Streptosporangiaceae bacterium]|jgi:hypothetical protein|nr:hypothetical protein [Streptosporangiaceae bacterium]
MPGRLPWPAALAVALIAVAAAGCAAGSTPGGGPASAGPAGSSVPMTPCGTTRTAAGVPVNIEIEHGTVPCASALAVERQYARALATGKVPGNGGGAPAKVQGWVCQGFTTPQVLATGNTSTCRKGGAQIVAVLAMQTPSASPS